MNLLCPNCQKTLTVPEQYAGQLMKCPLCSGTFTVPSLPPAPELSTPIPAPSAAQETYGVKTDPAPLPSPPPSAPLPALDTTPTRSSPSPAAPPAKSTSVPPVGYNHTRTLWLSPRVLQWFAPAAVVLIFFLQFFTWVGIMPGGVPAITQGAWSAAFATWTREVGTDNLFPFDFKQVEPDASGFLIPYTLLFLVTLVVTVAILVLPFLHIPLPPAVQKLLPYRWGIAAVLNLMVFFFLSVQLVVGFNLENKVANYAVKQADDQSKGKNLTTAEELQKQARIGETKALVKRTIWLRLAFLLHVVAVIGAGLMYWLTLRGESRPLPRLEFAY